MTPSSEPERPTTYAKARDLLGLVAAAGSGSALLAAGVYFAPDSIGGRPVSIDVLVAGYLTAVGGPAMAVVLYGVLTWLAQLGPAGTARLPNGERLLYRASSVVFGGAPMVWGAFTLAAWYGGGGGLPEPWFYLSCGLSGLTYVLALVAAVGFARRRQRDALAQAT